MTTKKYLGFAIGFLGFLPVILAPAPEEQLINGSSFLSWAELFMGLSVIASVIGWVIFRRLVHRGYSPLFVNGVGMSTGGIIALLSSFFFEWRLWNPLPVSHPWQFVGLTIASIIFANLIQYDLHGRLLKKYTATFLSFAGFIIPLITAVFGWIFLGEKVGINFFASAFAVAIGLALFYYEELKQGYITK